MTEKQQSFYWRLWGDVVSVHGWRMEKGRLVVGTRRAQTSEWERKVETFGRQLAAGQHRGLTVNDLRHGAHVVALGKDKSSKELSNGELDRVVTVFRLLIEPDDLDAQLKWDAYERGEDPGAIARTRWFIERKAPFAYIDAICRGKFGGIYESPFWEDLPSWALRDLARTLANRRVNFSQKATKETKAVWA